MKNDEFNDNIEAHNFEIFVEGQRSFIDYQKEDNIVYLLHTEVPEDQSNNGIAASLVEKTFEYLEERNLKVVPSCSYVKVFLRRHPEWNRILADE
ncbi:MAG: acetyltransferase [Pedobacter sp.]|jgi:predicted GNAT family acetyltransferase|nr:acetyltransferase [Pedobacter sp.]